MIDRDRKLGLARQEKAPGISRSSVYHLPRPRKLKGLLQDEGHEVGRRHVATLLNRMGIAAIHRRPTTSKPAPGHKNYSYLPRGLAVTRPKAADITDVRTARGFVYLVAVIDGFSRTVLLDGFQHLMPALGGGDDRSWIGLPDEGLRLCVVRLDEGVDCLLEVDEGVEDAVLEPSPGEFGEEALRRRSARSTRWA